MLFCKIRDVANQPVPCRLCGHSIPRLQYDSLGGFCSDSHRRDRFLSPSRRRQLNECSSAKLGTQLINLFRVCYVGNRPHAYNTTAGVGTAVRSTGGAGHSTFPFSADKLKMAFCQLLLGIKLHGVITSSYAIYAVNVAHGFCSRRLSQYSRLARGRSKMATATRRSHKS